MGYLKYFIQQLESKGVITLLPRNEKWNSVAPFFIDDIGEEVTKKKFDNADKGTKLITKRQVAIDKVVTELKDFVKS